MNNVDLVQHLEEVISPYHIVKHNGEIIYSSTTSKIDNDLLYDHALRQDLMDYLFQLDEPMYLSNTSRYAGMLFSNGDYLLIGPIMWIKSNKTDFLDQIHQQRILAAAAVAGASGSAGETGTANASASASSKVSGAAASAPARGANQASLSGTSLGVLAGTPQQAALLREEYPYLTASQAAIASKFNPEAPHLIPELLQPQLSAAASGAGSSVKAAESMPEQAPILKIKASAIPAEPELPAELLAKRDASALNSQTIAKNPESATVFAELSSVLGARREPILPNGADTTSERSEGTAPVGHKAQAPAQMQNQAPAQAQAAAAVTGVAGASLYTASSDRNCKVRTVQGKNAEAHGNSALPDENAEQAALASRFPAIELTALSVEDYHLGLQVGLCLPWLEDLADSYGTHGVWDITPAEPNGGAAAQTYGYAPAYGAQGAPCSVQDAASAAATVTTNEPAQAMLGLGRANALLQELAPLTYNFALEPWLEHSKLEYKASLKKNELSAKSLKGWSMEGALRLVYDPINSVWHAGQWRLASAALTQGLANTSAPIKAKSATAKLADKTAAGGAGAVWLAAAVNFMPWCFVLPSADSQKPANEAAVSDLTGQTGASERTEANSKQAAPKLSLESLSKGQLSSLSKQDSSAKRARKLKGSGDKFTPNGGAARKELGVYRAVELVARFNVAALSELLVLAWHAQDLGPADQSAQDAAWCFTLDSEQMPAIESVMQGQGLEQTSPEAKAYTAAADGAYQVNYCVLRLGQWSRPAYQNPTGTVAAAAMEESKVQVSDSASARANAGISTGASSGPDSKLSEATGVWLDIRAFYLGAWALYAYETCVSYPLKLNRLLATLGGNQRLHSAVTAAAATAASAEAEGAGAVMGDGSRNGQSLAQQMADVRLGALSELALLREHSFLTKLDASEQDLAGLRHEVTFDLSYLEELILPLKSFTTWAQSAGNVEVQATAAPELESAKALSSDNKGYLDDAVIAEKIKYTNALLRTYFEVSRAVSEDNTPIDHVALQEFLANSVISSKRLPFYEVVLSDVPHNAYSYELNHLQAVTDGDPERALRALRSPMHGREGRMGFTPLRHARNSAIINATLDARAAIRGGVRVETAYTLADYMILMSELCQTEEEAFRLREECTYRFAELVQQCQGKKTRKYSMLVNKILEEIERSVFIRVTREDLVKCVGRNEDYVQRVFKEEVGESLMEHLRRVRVYRAKELIANSDVKISEIAELLQFSSTSHFARVFKKYIGVSPAEYKEKHYQMQMQY